MEAITSTWGKDVVTRATNWEFPAALSQWLVCDLVLVGIEARPSPIGECVRLDLGWNFQIDRFVGRQFALWRDSQGKAHLFDAYCPHLGANLGFGGTVKDDCLSW